MLIGKPVRGQIDRNYWFKRRGQPRYKEDCELKMRGGCGEQRIKVGMKPIPAATCLCHFTAVAMHRATASALFVRHGRTRHTGEHGCCCKNQQQDGDEADDTAHNLTIDLPICKRTASMALATNAVGTYIFSVRCQEASNASARVLLSMATGFSLGQLRTAVVAHLRPQGRVRFPRS